MRKILLAFFTQGVKPEKKIDANGKQFEDYWASSKKVYLKVSYYGSTRSFPIGQRFSKERRILIVDWSKEMQSKSLCQAGAKL